MFARDSLKIAKVPPDSWSKCAIYLLILDPPENTLIVGYTSKSISPMAIRCLIQLYRRSESLLVLVVWRGHFASVEGQTVCLSIL